MIELAHKILYFLSCFDVVFHFTSARYVYTYDDDAIHMLYDDEMKPRLEHDRK